MGWYYIRQFSRRANSSSGSFLDLSNEELVDGDATIVVDSLPQAEEVDSGEEGVRKAERKHGGDVASGVL